METVIYTCSVSSELLHIWACFWVPLLPTCAWKEEDSRGNLSSHSTSYSFILHVSVSLSEIRCLLLSPETPPGTLVISFTRLKRFNFALQKYDEPRQRRAFAFKLRFPSGCEPRRELWSGLPLSRHRARFVFQCKKSHAWVKAYFTPFYATVLITEGAGKLLNFAQLRTFTSFILYL